MSDEKTFSPENEEIQGENSDTASADSAVQEAEIPTVMPLLAVRDIVVFNYMILPLFVGREKKRAGRGRGPERKPLHIHQHPEGRERRRPDAG